MSKCCKKILQIIKLIYLTIIKSVHLLRSTKLYSYINTQIIHYYYCQYLNIIYIINLLFMVNNSNKIYFGIIIRIAFIYILSNYQNSKSIYFTDIDYKVYSQAAQHVFHNRSPYQRHTYRYTPLLSYLMILNHYKFEIGKYIFVLFDALSMCLIQSIFKKKNFLVAMYAFNPLFIYLTLRGSCQSINCLLMLLFIYLIKRKDILLVGIIYGIWIHFRVYPILFGISFVLYFWKKNIKNTLLFCFGSALSFGLLFLYFYNKYSYEFIQNTYLYHLTRVDHRHNLSLYFYNTYLTIMDKTTILQQILKILPRIYLFSYVILKYHKSIELTIFLITHIFVIFNNVLTVQYYMWTFSSLILIFDYSNIITKLRWRKAIHMFAVWTLGVMLWVWLASKIQTFGENMFNTMWLSCLGRTLGQTWLLNQILKTLNFEQIKKDLKKDNQLKTKQQKNK